MSEPWRHHLNDAESALYEAVDSLRLWDHLSAAIDLESAIQVVARVRRRVEEESRKRLVNILKEP